MAKAVASLSVSLSARTKAFQKGLRNARKQLKAFSVSVANAAKRVARFTFGTIAAASAAVVFFTKKTLDQVDTLAKTADKLGVNIGQLQAYRFAAKQAGIATTSFDTGIQRLLRRFGEFEIGSGEAKAALKELGVNAKEFAGLDLDGKIRKLSKAFSRIASPTQKLRLAFKLFDTEGVALVNLLGLGEKGLDKVMKRIRELGGTITRDGARKIEMANNALSELGFALRRIAEQFTVALSPAVIAIGTEFATLVGSLIPSQKAFEDFFVSVAIGVDLAIVSIKQLGLEIKKMGLLLKVARNPLDALLGGYRLALDNINKEISKLADTFTVGEGGKFAKALREAFEKAAQLIKDFKVSQGGDGGGLPGAGRQQQFRQVDIKRFEVFSGTKANPVVVTAPKMEAWLERLARSSTGIPSAGGLLP